MNYLTISTCLLFLKQFFPGVHIFNGMAAMLGEQVRKAGKEDRKNSLLAVGILMMSQVALFPALSNIYMVFFTLFLQKKNIFIFSKYNLLYNL